MTIYNFIAFLNALYKIFVKLNNLNINIYPLSECIIKEYLNLIVVRIIIVQPKHNTGIRMIELDVRLNE